PMSASMLEVDGLKAWYGAAQILFEPSFHVGRGEVVALMGRNGAGKSTTIKALMGLVTQRDGVVRFLGEEISRLRPFEIARRGLGQSLAGDAGRAVRRRCAGDCRADGQCDRRAKKGRSSGAPLRAEHPFRRARLRPRLRAGERAAAVARPHGRSRGRRGGTAPSAVGVMVNVAAETRYV